MTRPTDEQIGAVTKAMQRFFPCCNYSRELLKPMAVAALTAAAEVDTSYAEVSTEQIQAMNTAAAEAGLASYPNMKPLTDEEAEAIKDTILLVRESVRERCARIAENYTEDAYHGGAIAAAIRKDGP